MCIYLAIFEIQRSKYSNRNVAEVQSQQGRYEPWVNIGKMFFAYQYLWFLQFVVALGDKVAPTDIEEGMRVGWAYTYIKYIYMSVPNKDANGSPW